MDYEITDSELEFKPIEIKLKIENINELIELVERLEIDDRLIKKRFKRSVATGELRTLTNPFKCANFIELYLDLIDIVEDYLETMKPKF